MFTSRVHVMEFRGDAPAMSRTAAAALAAPNGGRLDYHGGKVIQNVHITQVLYGSGAYIPEFVSTSGMNMASAYMQIATSGAFDWLTEYSSMAPLQTIARGWFDGSVQISPRPSRNGSLITDANVQSELAAQIRADGLPSPGDNRIYMVSFPPDKTLVSPDGALSCVAGGFCAYHGTFKIGPETDRRNVYYAVLPAMTAGCAAGCGAGTMFESQQLVASHEVIGMVTDPEVGLATVTGPPLAWYGPDDNEIGDLCVGQSATFIGIDNHSYTIQKGYSNQNSSCIARQPSRTQHQIFRGLDGHVHELLHNGTFWTSNNDLTASLAAASPAGNVAGYSFGNTQSIAFRTDDGHLHRFHHDGASWVNEDLTDGGAGAVGDPAVYTLRNTQHIIFRSADDHVHELYHDGARWADNDLTTFLRDNSQPAISMAGSPSGFIRGDTQHIVFRGADGALHQYYNNGLVWSDQNLSVMGGVASFAGDPSGYAMANTEHFVFLDAADHIHDLHLDKTGWTNHDLTTITGGASSRSIPSAYVLSDTQHIVFRGADGHLHELCQDGAHWVDNDLNRLIGGTAPEGDPWGYVLGNTQHIAFRGTDNHLHEFYNDGASWVDNDLTVRVGGIAPGDRVSGYVSP